MCFKKVALADQAAVFANAVFEAPDAFAAPMAGVGVLAFSFQIYFDFSAYTDMARGLGYLLGLQLPENFRQPYGALGVRDFWRRWHISLSTWLRDYLYIPLGGSRGGRWRTYRNLMLTMLLGGLWHGAGWNFVIWGGLHGGWLIFEARWLSEARAAALSRLSRFLLRCATFALVCFAWIFFRASTLSQALEVLAALGRIPADPFTQLGLFNPQNWLLGIFAPGLVVLAGAARPLDPSLRSWPRVWACGLIVGLICLIALLAGGSNEFIYFQF